MVQNSTKDKTINAGVWMWGTHHDELGIWCRAQGGSRGRAPVGSKGRSPGGLQGQSPEKLKW